MRPSLLLVGCVMLAGCHKPGLGPVAAERSRKVTPNREIIEALGRREPREGMTEVDVRAALGIPDARRPFRTTTGRSAEIWVYSSHEPPYTLEFIDGIVTRIQDDAIKRATKEL